MNDPALRSIFVYDAACVLCSRSANFVAGRDREGRFMYADLSSAFGQDLVRSHGLDPADLDAVVLVDGDKAWTGSTATLRIVTSLPFPWWLLRPLLLVPRPLREPPYRFLARNRHRLFSGRTCPEPEPRLRERLLS